MERATAFYKPLVDALSDKIAALLSRYIDTRELSMETLMLGCTDPSPFTQWLHAIRGCTKLASPQLI